MDDYLNEMLAKHRTKLLEHLSHIEPPCEDDDTNPFVTFWAMVDMGAEFHAEIKCNDRYFASGRCGACETCGCEPFPRVPYNAAEQYMNHMRVLFPLMDERDIKVREENAVGDVTTDTEVTL